MATPLDKSADRIRPMTAPIGVQSLPLELITLILENAAVASDRNRSYLNLMLVCKAFTAPSRRLLHRDVVITTRLQAQSVLLSIEDDTTLCTATKRLTLAYGEREPSPPPVAAVDPTRSPFARGANNLLLQNQSRAAIHQNQRNMPIQGMQQVVVPSAHHHQGQARGQAQFRGVQAQSLCARHASASFPGQHNRRPAVAPNIIAEGHDVLTTPALPPPPRPTREQAFSIFESFSDLRELDLNADDELAVLLRFSRSRPNAPPFTKLQTLRLTGPKISWETLCELFGSSEMIHTMRLRELYEATEADRIDEEAVEEEEEDGAEIDYVDGDDSDDPTGTTSNAAALAQAVGTLDNDDDDDSHSTPALSSRPIAIEALLGSSEFSLPIQKLVLDKPSISDSIFITLAGSVRSTLTHLHLSETSKLTRPGLITILGGLPNLLELDLNRCVLPPFRTTRRDLPDRSLSIDHMNHPLDYLSTLCPFLQWLRIGSDDLCSSGFLIKLVRSLPLSSLSLGLTSPRLGPEDIDEMLLSVPAGRLDSLYIDGARMRWRKEAMEVARRYCDDAGTMFSGEACEEPRFAL